MEEDTAWAVWEEKRLKEADEWKEQYLERCKQAIACEKKAAAAHKAAGRTKEALHSMRRAKLMTDEVAEAAG